MQAQGSTLGNNYACHDEAHRHAEQGEGAVILTAVATQTITTHSRMLFLLHVLLIFHFLPPGLYVPLQRIWPILR